ncbi:EpsG family protein [Marinobacter maritimus]|uniref:EpsG family protein n=1 Tax=Marinobacter maritimus TaxID=277961 RepID=UPI0011A8EF03|nr:EpsG family protein [Marinobacter maritimus]
MIHFTLYFFVLLLSWIALVSNIDNKKVLNTCLAVSFFLVLYLVIGFRVDSIDYVSYKSIFEKVNFSQFSIPIFNSNEGSSGREFLFASSVSLFKLLNLSFESFIAFIAFLSVFIKFNIFWRNSPYFWLSVLIYLSFSYFKDLGQIRSALSATILVFSFNQIVSRKFHYYIIYVIIAAGIQIFLIFAVILYVFHWYFHRYLKLFLLFFSLFLPDLIFYIYEYSADFIRALNPFIFYKINGYMAVQQDINVFGLGNIFRVSVVAAMIFMGGWLNFSKSSIVSVSLSSVSLGLIFYNCFSFIPAVAERSIDVFVFLPACLLFPIFVSKMAGGVQKQIVFMLVVLYCLAFFIGGVSSAGEYRNLLLV